MSRFSILKQRKLSLAASEYHQRHKCSFLLLLVSPQPGIKCWNCRLRSLAPRFFSKALPLRLFSILCRFSSRLFRCPKLIWKFGLWWFWASICDHLWRTIEHIIQFWIFRPEYSIFSEQNKIIWLHLAYRIFRYIYRVANY